MFSCLKSLTQTNARILHSVLRHRDSQSPATTAMKDTAGREPVNEMLKGTQQLLQSLVESSSHVQILKGKWSLVRTKVTILDHRLAELSTPAVAEENPLSSELLRSVAVTCSAATSLASICHSPSPPGGKLKTQNDVDSLSAYLDAHINDLDVLTRSISPAVVCSGRRESVRVEARNLMTRLQIGSTESRSSALDSLLGLLQEDDKNVLIAVAQGMVPVLVHLLDSTSSCEIKEKTVTAIARISTVDSTRHVLLAEGLTLLNDLLRVLESGSIFAKEKSCIALETLSHSKENARAIGSRGGISSLLEICQQGTPNSQALAAGVLRNLAVFDEIKENFVEENAVLILLGLCNSGTALAQENSLGCLCNLIQQDDGLKLLFVREGGIESVKNFWDSSANAAQNLEVAVHMVTTLATCSTIAAFLVTNGFLSLLFGMLHSVIVGVRISAAKALCDLCYSTKTTRELGEMGCNCIPILVIMLDGKVIEEKAAAAKLLSILMKHARNRRIFRKQEKGIVSTVKLLDPSVENLTQKHLVCILASLEHHKKCRKQMISAGACVYLQRLAELDVDGAKRLLDCLRHGKLWRVFARSWV